MGDEAHCRSETHKGHPRAGQHCRARRRRRGRDCDSSRGGALAGTRRPRLLLVPKSFDGGGVARGSHVLDAWHTSTNAARPRSYEVGGTSQTIISSIIQGLQGLQNIYGLQNI